MTLPLTSTFVFGALLTASAVAPHATTPSDATAEPADVVADAPVLPTIGACPAYEGPQCDSQAHEQWATGQDLAAMAGLVPVPRQPAGK